MPTEEELLAQSFKGSTVSTDDEGALPIDGASVVEPTNVEQIATPPVEEPAVEEPVTPPVEEPAAAEVETPPVEDTKAPVVEDIKKEVEEPVTQKSFEELLAEKTEGKFNSFEELQAELNKEHFHDEQIKLLNDLKKNGQELDANFWKLQSKDFKNMTDPEEILLESMRLNPDYEGYNDRQLRLELDDKYRRRDWAEDGEEPTDVEELQSARFKRDSVKAREDLIRRQDELTTVPKVDPAVAEQAKAEQLQAEENWKNQINEISGKTQNLPILIDEKSKESFDFAVTDSDRADATKTMIEMGSNPLAFFDRFKKEDGSFDNQGVYEAVLKFNNLDKMAKIIHQNALAKGAEKEVKSLKNTNFTTDSKPPEVKKGGLAAALAQAEGLKV